MIKCYYIVNNYTCFFCQKQCDKSQAGLLKCSKSLFSEVMLEYQRTAYW